MMFGRFPLGGWSPIAMGPKAWWSADRGVTLSGSNVTAWADQSGHGFDLTNSGNYPTYSASGYNGHPSIEFNGHQWLVNTSAGLGQWITSVGTAISVFATLDTAAGAYHAPLSWHSTGLTNWLQYFATTPSNHMAGDVNGSFVPGSATTSGKKRLVWCCDGATLNTYVNGVSDLVTSFSASVTTDIFWCGVDLNGAGFYADRMTELILVAGDASAYVARYEAYAKAKWG